MSTVKIANLLFPFSKTDLHCCNKRIAMTGISGTGLSHLHDHKSGTTAKYSSAGKLFDAVMKNSIRAYKDPIGTVTYVELDYSGETTNFLIKNNSIKVSSPDYEIGVYTIVPYVCHTLLFGENEELKTLCSQIMEQLYETGTSDAITTLTFCDSFYYGLKESTYSIEIERNLDMAEIEAAFRSNSFEKADIFGKNQVKESVFYRKKEEKPEKITEEESDVMKDCKQGFYFVPYDWDKEQSEYIQPLAMLDDFVPSPVFKSALKKINIRTQKVLSRMNEGLSGIDAIKSDYINFLMVGKPGTGKTALAYALSAATGMPIYTVNMSQNTDEDEFEGKTKIVDGHPEFVTTDFLKAYENGGIVILEEPNLANPAVMMGALGQAIEFPFIVKKNGYETVRRHPLCIIIGAMNVGTVGSKQLSQAFANRFKQTYMLDDPSKEEFISILQKKSGAGNKKCTWVYEAYQKITNYLKSAEVNAEDICMNMSLRTCLGCLECMEEGDSPKEAVLNSMIGAIAEADLQIAIDAKNDVLRTLRNPSFSTGS